MKFGFYHYLIVLIKLCLDAGDDFSIILCNFGSFLVRDFKVISYRGGPPKRPLNPPPPGGKKKASYEQKVKRICVFVFVA